MLTHCVYCITYPYWMIYVTVFAHTWSLFFGCKDKLRDSKIDRNA